MKNVLLYSLFLIFALGLSAQTTKQPQKSSSTYDRSAITVLLLNFPNESRTQGILRKFSAINYSSKFYNNNINYQAINAAFKRTDIYINPATSIKQTLDESKVANQIIAKWYSRKNDGTMSQDLVHQRGVFNATDATLVQSKTTKRGNAQLEEYGNRLINKSYILVIDFQNVMTMAEAKETGLNGWQSDVKGYLFKIDYNEEMQKSVYDNWIYEDDSEQVKADKKKQFDLIRFPVNYVMETRNVVQASQSLKRTDLAKAIHPDKTTDELLMDLIQSGYENSTYSLERGNEEFQVKTGIDQIRPISAKIGTKEGLKTDHRYFAYEFVYRERNNSTKKKYRGVVRATARIADNNSVATGASESTVFYQTAGRHLKQGYSLQQRNDKGIEISLGAGIGAITTISGLDGVNDYSARIDFRLGRFVGIRSLFVWIEGGFESKDYYMGYSTGNGQSHYRGIGFMHTAYGIAKGMKITRNVELRAYVGLGSENAAHSEWKDTNFKEGVTSGFYKGGLMLSKNLTRGIQLYGNIGYYYFSGKIKNSDKDDIVIKNTEIPVKWQELFPKRDDPSLVVGIKIGF